MKRQRFENIRELVQKLREAESGADMAPRLLSDTRFALLELLDELKEHGLVEMPMPRPEVDVPRPSVEIRKDGDGPQGKDDE